jgi:hypothetical protein
MRVIEDRACSDRELIIASLAVEQLLSRREFNYRAVATKAVNTVRPAQTNEQFAAFVIGVEQVYNVN